MPKTTFINGDPSQGLRGTRVTAEYLNAVNNHHHTGLDEDGHGALPYAADTGTANEYVVNLNPPLAQYINGMTIYFKAANSNSGVSSLNVDGIGAKRIKKSSYDLQMNDILAGQLMAVAYDGTAFQLLNPNKPIGLLELLIGTWMERSNPKNIQLNDICWGNNELLGVGENDGSDSYVLASSDGVSWTERTGIAGQPLKCIAWGNSLYVAGANIVHAGGSAIFTSPDGITWTPRLTPADPHYFTGIAWNGSLFVGVGWFHVYTSPDGITWTLRLMPSSGLWDVCWSPESGLFVAVGGAGGVDAYILTSPDGITWTERSNPKNVILNGVAWSAEKRAFAAVGAADGTDAYILTSPDGVNWTERANPKNIALYDVAWNGSLFCAVGAADGADAYILTSPDGVNWTERTNQKNIALNGVAWNPNGPAFCAVGAPDGADAYIATTMTW